MNESSALSTPHQQTLLELLFRSLREAAEAEVQLLRDRDDRDAAARRQHEADREFLTVRHRSTREELNGDFHGALEEARKLFEETSQQLATEQDRFTSQSQEDKRQALDSARRQQKRAVNAARNNYTQQQQTLQEQENHHAAQSRLRLERFEQLRAEATELLRRRGFQLDIDTGLDGEPAIANDVTSTSPASHPPQDIDDLPADALAATATPPPDTLPPSEPTREPIRDEAPATTDSLLRQFETGLNESQGLVQRLRGLATARFFEEGWPVLILIFTAMGLVYPAYRLFTFQGWQWAAMVLGGAVAVTLLSVLVLRPLARKHTQQIIAPLKESLSASWRASDQLDLQARKAFQQRRAQLIQQCDAAIRQAETVHRAKSSEIASAFDQLVDEKTREFREQREANNERWENASREINQHYREPIEKLDQQADSDLAQLDRELQAERTANANLAQAAYELLLERWQAIWQTFLGAYYAAHAYCEERFQEWDAIDWQSWRPPDAELPALRFGEYEVSLDDLTSQFPQNSQLDFPETQLRWPAFLTYPDAPSLLLRCEESGRQQAVHNLQSTMLRLLTSLPAGKVRFTIIDPVGLGQNFSAFMHLADFDERLVANRIWTESSHINQRLLDLTEHMENVIQKYLRNEFDSIQQYNRNAGEVAEPFQVLVVANFPANFSDEAARRLVSIAASGARCGVYTLISTDERLDLPRNFEISDLESHATTLTWSSALQRFQWQQPQLQPYPLSLDVPPEDKIFSQAVRAAGHFAEKAGRVEVPFALVAPQTEQQWSRDSASGIEVPLGRAGATQVQSLKLGRGTSQHVLISGKTGSGKSTLLHAIITNVALYYPPDQVELFLIDFKKGVEFKCYAHAELPHARVIAIESEREFGMSVLERLDTELKVRGDLFRQHGVQDVAGYRRARPDARLPRILLIIDEFQEFFTKEDRVAHEASLLLDRLVRQGRAFGIHVILGSQTLAGAYTLARSTIGQMAVRIALQCSEADAHLILSDDNSAARLLHRAGEAIYNDANGLFEGNHPFQVVWLPDHERDAWLKQIQQWSLADAASETSRADTIVFEGNAASAPESNPPLQRTLEALAAETDSTPEASLDRTQSHKPARIWPGESVSIQPPPEIVLSPHSGANAVVVGGEAELALGVLGNAVLHCAATLGRQASNSRFVVLDGTPEHSDVAAFWQQLITQTRLNIQRVPPGETIEVMQVMSEELERRSSEPAPAPDREPWFVLIHDLARFRELRRRDDELSFSSFSEPSREITADRTFRDLLQQGPAVGLHCIMWCDSYKNLTRWLDRPSLRDIETRILAQMSASDSSHLMDSPAASQLGPHRAILYREEKGTWEKIRPYAVPSREWMATVADACRGTVSENAP